jgi:hypothetical protein
VPDDGYEYLLGMKDEMSPAGKRAAAGLDDLTGALKRSDSALKQHESAHRDAASATRDHGEALKGLSLGFAKGLFGVGGLSAAIAEGELLAKTFEKLGEMGREAFKFAIEASEFKEAAVDAYTIVRGTAAEGERTFRELDRVAREIHMPSEKAQQMASQLMIEGLESQRAVTDTVRAVGDLQRVGLEAGAGKIQSIVERSISAGHFDIGKGARSLKGTGVTLDTLAEELGMGRKQFESQMKAGKISVETGIEALDNTILKGKVGQLATKKFTLSDAFVDMKNSIRGLFQETDSSPLTSAVQDVTNRFTEGTKEAESLREAFNGVMVAAGGLVRIAGDIASAFTRTWDAMVDGANAAVDAITQINPALSAEQKHQAAIKAEIANRARHGHLGALVGKRDEGEEALNEAAGRGAKPEELKKIAKRYDLVIAAGKDEVGKMLAAHAKLPEGERVNATKEEGGRLQIMGYQPSGDERNVNIGGASPEETRKNVENDLRKTGEAAGDGLKGGVTDKLEIHSPSAVMYDIGEHAAIGLAAGAAAAADRYGRSDAPTPPTTRDQGGRRVHVDVDVGGIQLHGVANAEEFLPLLESQIADVFERVAMEMGA